jgi:tetratricopeptide (TPR) repeat protein
MGGVKMSLKSVVLFAALTVFACASELRAQEAHQHQHQHGAEELGRVNFPISCNVAAQKQFNRAAAWLHSFGYAEADKAFEAVTVVDPKCGMAYWGIAMSQFHPIWVPPTPAELKKGLSAVEKARTLGAATHREKSYIAAIEGFFKDADKIDHRTRALAYQQAMEQIYRRYPEDREAAIFYALSLLEATTLPLGKDYSKQKKAAEILNRVLPQEPNHPGVAHYVIHSFDYPQLAEMALPAARSYAKIAPSSPHALHMPTHIFTRLGLWQESIQSNAASAASAKALVARTHPGAASFDQLHAMDYLMYAYLQGAQDQKAKGILDELNPMNRVDVENFAAAYAFAAAPARYALERRRWAEAASLTIHPATFPWNSFLYAEAITHFARALGAARNGDPAAARKSVEKLASIQKTLASASDNPVNQYWARQVEIQRQAAEAWTARAEGKKAEALQLMRAAADLEASTDKHPVTPGAVLPARELLGDLLLDLNQPAEALKEYETSLRDAPNRFNGLYGAARAAELAEDQAKATTYYDKLISLCSHAEDERAELKRAREFVAKK